MTDTVCVLCAEPVDPDAEDTYCEEVGFAQKRSEGGLHSLALRRGTNGFAHAECVDKLRT